MNDIVYGIAIVPLIVGVVQVFKASGLPDRFAPIVSLTLGLLTASGLAVSQNTFSAESVLTGAAFGLAASGLYSGVQAVRET